MQDLLGIVARLSIMYLYALAVLRLAGKRSLHHLSPLDFLIGLVLGDLFDDAIWAEVPLAQALVAFATVILLHIFMTYLTYRSTTVHRLVESTRTEIFHMGKWIEAGLARERTPKEEALAQIRLQGEEKLKELREAAWEPGGQISVFKREEYKPVQKRDLERLQELYE
jgi:uncharacterized membrane protein YcaP (DUF421 family)